ncbi:MAG: hypothetical protein WCP55_09040 [Lentisphaerota bacterium]
MNKAIIVGLLGLLPIQGWGVPSLAAEDKSMNEKKRLAIEATD